MEQSIYKISNQEHAKQNFHIFFQWYISKSKRREENKTPNEKT